MRIPRSHTIMGTCLFAFIPLFCIVSAFSSCSHEREQVYRKSMILMDTLVTIHVVSDSPEKAEKAMDSAFSVIRTLDGLLSFYSDTSDVARINRSAGIAASMISEDTLAVLERALFASEKTDGAFDVTIGPQISLWDFSKKQRPDDDTVKKNLTLVNYRLLTLDKNRSTAYLSKKGMRIDLGGIAKGFAADKAVAELKKEGIRAGLVSVAGDIRGFGIKPDGKAWRVGVRDPRSEHTDDIMATIELRDIAISTAGDYERYFVVDGIRYHHLLDPKTGYPAQLCRSVTVIAPEGVLTDSLSTAVFILGPDRGMKVLEQMGVGGLIIDATGKMHMTRGMESIIEFKRSS